MFPIKLRFILQGNTWLMAKRIAEIRRKDTLLQQQGRVAQ